MDLDHGQIKLKRLDKNKTITKQLEKPQIQAKQIKQQIQQPQNSNKMNNQQLKIQNVYKKCQQQKSLQQFKQKSKEQHLQQQYESQQNNSEEQKQKYRLTQNYELSLQTLMYANVFNLINFTSSATLYFKLSTQFDIANIVLFCFSLAFYIGNAILFVKNPTIFGCFCSSFREETLAKYHYFIYMLIIVLSIIFLALCTDKVYINLPILFLMIIYTLTYKPYQYLMENYRSALNFFSMFCWLGFSLISQYESNKMISYGLFCMNLWGLLPISIICSFVSIFYYNHHKNFVQNINQEAVKQTIQFSETEIKKTVQQNSKSQLFIKPTNKQQYKKSFQVPQLDFNEPQNIKIQINASPIQLIKTTDVSQNKYVLKKDKIKNTIIYKNLNLVNNQKNQPQILKEIKQKQNKLTNCQDKQQNIKQNCKFFQKQENSQSIKNNKNHLSNQNKNCKNQQQSEQKKAQMHLIEQKQKQNK